MWSLLIAGILFAATLQPSNSQQCAIPGLDAYVDRKDNASAAVLNNIQTVATSVVPGLSEELGNASVNSSMDLYDALTTTLGVENSSSFQSFTVALKEITDAYFLACYGNQNQQPTQDDLIPTLQDLLTLLDTLTSDNADEELPSIRAYFGVISCLIDTYGYDYLLQVTTPTDTVPTAVGGTSSPTSPPGLINCSNLAGITIEAFYACISLDNLEPIFGLGPLVYIDSENQPQQSKRCVGFVVDTTGSMASEIVEVRNNIKNFIALEQNLPACYVLIDFNDYGAPSPSGNVGTAKVYDPEISYGSEGSTLTRTGGLPVKGVQELYNDVDALYASGGGDCPEYGMTGILKVLEAIGSVEGLILPEQGNLHHIITLTDASAKDDYRYQEVIDAATTARATVHFFYSGGGCGGTFGNFETVRITTGGIAVNNFADFDALSEFIQLYSEAVEASSGSARRKRTADDIFSEPAASHSVYVNYLIDSLAILAQTTQSSVTILKPDGQQQILAVSGVLALYTDDNPIPGLWSISVSSGTLQVVISAPTLLELDISYTTTNKDGELIPTQDIPFACDTGTILATSPQLNKISLEHPLYLNLLDSTGNVLLQVELTECGGILSGIVTYPSAPLVFYQLQGHDIGGNPFKKTISDQDVTFRPPNILISLFNSYSITVNPGNTSFSKLELYYNQPSGVILDLLLGVTSSSSDLVTYFIDVPQSITVGNKVYAVFETQAPADVLPGTSGYSVMINITESCIGSPIYLTNQVIFYQPVPLAVANTSQVVNERNLRVSWQEPNIPSSDSVWQYRIHLDYDNSTVRQVDVDSDTREYTLDRLQPYQQVYISVEARSAANETLARTSQLRFRSREDVPGPVTQVIHTVTSNSTAQIQWDSPPTPNGVILYYVVSLWDVADARELNSSYVDALKERIVIYDHLEQYIRYEASISGATSEGLGESRQRQFYTKEGEPTNSPRNIRIHPITTTSANISWDPPSVRERRGFITHYDVTIGYNEQSGQHVTVSEYNLGEDNTSRIFEDLPQYGRISVEVSCTTVGGESPVSDPTTGIIELPPSAPRSFEGRPIGSSSVSLSWLPPEKLNGNLLGYTIFFRTEDSTNQAQEDQELVVNIYDLADTEAPTVQIDDLTAPATHTFTVTGFNSAGNGEKSEQISVTLKDNSWIIILCGALGGVLIFTICIIIILVAACIVLSRRRNRNKKQGVFEVFQNEDDTVDRSATNPMYEEADNTYEDADEVLEGSELKAIPDNTEGYNMASEDMLGQAIPSTNTPNEGVLSQAVPSTSTSNEDMLTKAVPSTNTPSKAMPRGVADQAPEQVKLKPVSYRKTAAQLERERELRELKTVPDKIDHYEHIITKKDDTGYGAATAWTTTNPAEYVNVDGKVDLSSGPQHK